MQSVTKIAAASLAMLLLGSSALLAQPYGYGRYGNGYNAPYGYGGGQDIVRNGPTPGYCGPHTSQMTNWILDPQTGRPITESQYLSRYPSNPAQWSYSCETGLWTDPAAQPQPNYQQSQNYGYDRGRGYYRGR